MNLSKFAIVIACTYLGLLSNFLRIEAIFAIMFISVVAARRRSSSPSTRRSAVASAKVSAACSRSVSRNPNERSKLCVFEK